MRLKKAICFVLCFVLALPLFACSKDVTGGPGVGGGQTYTVVFYVGTDAAAAGVTVHPESIDVKSGGTIAKLPVPSTYAGQTFQGWYTAAGKLFTTTTPVTSDMTVTAKWKSNQQQEEEAAEYEKSITPANGWKEGHLYVHYMRRAHDASEEGNVKNSSAAPTYNGAISSTAYGNWGLWGWPVGNANGRLFNAAFVDASGAVYDIDLTKTYNDCGWNSKANGGLGATPDPAISIDYSKYNNQDSSFGVLLHMISSRTNGGHWIGDQGDRTVPLGEAYRPSVGYHWFISEGSAGKATFTSEVLNNPYKDIPEGSAVTRKDGPGMLDSASDNSSQYPTWGSRVQNFDSSTGYQIFIGSFADSDGDNFGDIRGIINKLDYLESLNVDILWLTPFQDSTNYHGYDIKDYFSVDSRFGTIADYRELVYKVHQRGMKIVMDFVLNHTSKSNPWFGKSQQLVVENKGEENEIDYRQFYNWINEETYNNLHDCTPASKKADKHECEKDQWYGDPYGYYFYSSFSSDMPELNYDYQPVRDAVLEVCDYWMSFGLDGFRLDAVKHIYMENEIVPVGKTLSGSKGTQPGSAVIDDGLYSHDQKRNVHFYREFNYRLKTMHPNAFVVGENLDGYNARTAPYYAGIDSQFEFNTYFASRSFATIRGINNLNGGSKTDENWMGAVFGNEAYMRGYTEFRKVNPNFIGGQFTSNHDLPRARNRMALSGTDGAEKDTYGRIQGTDLINDSENLLYMYYGFLMTLPGVTWIYYGDELGMEGVMDYTINNNGSTDSLLSDPHEDRVYRQPMKWKANGNASYEIGYETLKAELTGINATSSVKSVEELTTGISNGHYSFQSGSLIEWVQTLGALRKQYQLGKATNISGSGSGNKITYTVTGGNGSLTVTIVAGSGATSSKPAGAKAFWSGTVAGKTCSVTVA